MKPFHLRALSVAVFALAVCWAIPVVSGQDAKRDLTEFRTVETALTAKISKAGPDRVIQPGFLGILLTDQQGKLVVAQVEPDSPADKAGLKEGDQVAKLASAEALRDLLSSRGPGETLTLDLMRDKEPLQVTATLAAPSRLTAVGDTPMVTPKKKGGGNFDTRSQGVWRRDVYRLAVISVEYPDMKHNDKIEPKDWEDALFSKGTYNKKSVTGQTVYGSMNDYYHELSYNTIRVEGKAFPWVMMSKKRIDYDTGSKAVFFKEAVDKLLERDGKDALAKFDGVFFMHAGGRVQTVRGGLYWPHRSSFTHEGKRWPYFICPEGAGQMANISVICHEFGHLLGLPDLYARPENPGSEGVGVWCAMSNQIGNGRPQHFCAWSKETLGWVKPVVIDPAVKQKLILAPIYHSPKECFKVLVRPDASEYFLLENRNGKGFDASLPAQGLLIWRVVRGRPILEESHGNTGPNGPRVSLPLVPFPSSSNDAFTPYTVPSSRAQLGGAPVHITNIRRMPDGRITFYVGFEFY